MGLTYVDEHKQITRRVQLYGRITKLTANTLHFEPADGQGEFSVPFDGELELAQDAIYTLSSTGEQVSDIDFLVSWTIHPPNREPT